MKTFFYLKKMSWPPTQEDAERVKFLRQMELALKDEARTKKMEISELKKQNSFAKYVLQFFEEETKNKI